MTARTEFRVVVERDGLQWPIQPPYDEPTTDRGAAEALGAAARRYAESVTDHDCFRFDRVFVVHRRVTESGWETDDGRPWDEQAARDGLLAVANERRYT